VNSWSVPNCSMLSVKAFQPMIALKSRYLSLESRLLEELLWISAWIRRSR
jgi:hypothetical protein